MSYTVRTCHVCGLRKPQPEMVKATIKVPVGGSKGSASGATVVGALLGDKKSQRAIGTTVFNSSARSYHRTRQVWICGSAECRRAVGMGMGGDGSALGGVIGIALLVLLFFAVVGVGKIFGTAEEREAARTKERVEQVQRERAATQAMEDEGAIPTGPTAPTTTAPVQETTNTASVGTQADRAALRDAFNALPQDRRVRIQEILAQRGLYIATPDGVVGRRTLDALAAAAILARESDPDVLATPDDAAAFLEGLAEGT